MDQIMTGAATPAQIAAFGVSMTMKRPTAAEVRDLADRMLGHALRVPTDVIGTDTVDIVGTGGERSNTVNLTTMAAIVADLDTRRSPLHVAVENVEHDLNIGSIVRTANACNDAGVHIVGRRRWNRRGAMVTDAYLSIAHHPDPADLRFYPALGSVLDNLR